MFLIGRPPLGEYLGFITVQTLNGAAADLGTLSDEWRAANNHIRDLECQEAGLADNPPICPLPPELASLAAAVTADPIMRRTFSIVPTSLGLVELNRLVVFQKHIDLTYVRQVQQTLGPAPSLEEIGRLCLPFDHPHPSFGSRRIAQNAYVSVSPSDDFRFLEPILLDSFSAPLEGGGTV